MFVFVWEWNDPSVAIEPPLLEPTARSFLAGPGLAKARPPSNDLVGDRHGYAVVAERRPVLWSIRETWIQRLLEDADIFSEGESAHEMTPEGERQVYYGSTSLRCTVGAVRSHIEGLPSGELLAPTEIAQALLANPCARLTAVRIARREATVRADASLNVMHAELSARVLCEADGVRLAFDVDVSAELARLHERVRSSE